MAASVAGQMTIVRASKEPAQTFPRPVKGTIVECLVCHEKISQKSIKNHFVRKHPGHDYEEQKKFFEESRRLSRSPKVSPKKPRSTPVSPLAAPRHKASVVSVPPTPRTADPDAAQSDRQEVIVACLICCEMMSTKSMKGHFARHHPEDDYEALKASMSGASPMKSNAELVTCSACKETVSSRTLKVHILKNHPNLDYKSTLKASREGVVKLATPGTIVLKSNHKPASRSIQLVRAGLTETSSNGYHSEPRFNSKNEVYPCILCKKEVVFQNMRKHFNRKHPDELSKYEEMKGIRTAERNEYNRAPKLSRVSDPMTYASGRLEVNNNGDDDDYAPSALLKEIEQEMAEEYGMDPYSRILNGREDGLHVQVTEQVIRFETDDDDAKFTEINPPSSKVVPIGSAASVDDLTNSLGEGSESRKRKISDVDYDSSPEDQELYKRLATENYMLERQILYLQEQEQFLERKMVAYQRIMERKMREFEEKLRTEFEQKSTKIIREMELREIKMKDEMNKHDEWLARRLAEQRRLIRGNGLAVDLPSPPTSDDKSESSKSSESDSAEKGSAAKKGGGGKASDEPISVDIVNSGRRSVSNKSSPVASSNKSSPKLPEKKIDESINEPIEEEDLPAFISPEDNMDFSYETETETEEESPSLAAADDEKRSSRRNPALRKMATTKAKKSRKSVKTKPVVKVKLKAMVSAAALAKRKTCVPCARSFRDSHDYNKHCQTKTHRRTLREKTAETTTVEDVEEDHKCDDYGCLICGLNFENSDGIKSHLKEGCKSGDSSPAKA